MNVFFSFSLAQGKYMGNGNASSVTIATNHSSITEHLSSICYGAQLKYDAKAYLHWYEKYGCEQVGKYHQVFVMRNTVWLDMATHFCCCSILY